MKFRDHIKSGIGFGLTSSIITTIGLMVGLSSATNLRIAVIGGVITIAIVDALSDAFAMHISEESTGDESARDIWASTFSTFGAKFFFAIIFIVPVLLLSLQTAIIVSIAMGLLLITVFSVWIAQSQNENPAKVVAEHLFIAIVVLVLAYFAGAWIASVFV
ncbi:MAG: hypothetical protein KAS30_00270 [Candidatus Diapherotrites archaeon]|nr:hypothetical protein [Candidatus Diapherotrites archaeon]